MSEKTNQFLVRNVGSYVGVVRWGNCVCWGGGGGGGGRCMGLVGGGGRLNRL